ncbi:MAG TPA: CopD family protein [Rhodopila sp.]|nr:CopD family protein [Rhodopila sp.]
MFGAANLPILRGLHLSAMLCMLGTQAFLAWLLPAATTRDSGMSGRLAKLWWICGAIALLTGGGWLAIEAAAMAEAHGLPAILNAMALVVGHTRFGQVVSLRLALLALATLLAGSGQARLYPALVLTAVAAALEGLIAHAGAAAGVAGNTLVTSEALHLLAAGLWLGALPALWLSVRALPYAAAAGVCEQFSPIGLGCVVVLAGSGLIQAAELVGGLPALLDTPYGRLATLKIGLFLAALVLAACNRLWLTDRLVEGVPAARRDLLTSVAIETLIGLAIVITAAFLASTMPSADAPASMMGGHG